MHYKKIFVKIRYQPHLDLTRYHSVQESIIDLKNLLKIMAIDFKLFSIKITLLILFKKCESKEIWIRYVYQFGRWSIKLLCDDGEF